MTNPTNSTGTTFAAQRILDLETQRDALLAMIDSLALRVAIQAEMLGKSAEKRGESADRIGELERALAPFAAVLAGGWDTGELAASALYPVPMGELRRAARVYSGLSG